MWFRLDCDGCYAWGLYWKTTIGGGCWWGRVDAESISHVAHSSSIFQGRTFARTDSYAGLRSPSPVPSLEKVGVYFLANRVCHLHRQCVHPRRTILPLRRPYVASPSYQLRISYACDLFMFYVLILLDLLSLLFSVCQNFIVQFSNFYFKLSLFSWFLWILTWPRKCIDHIVIWIIYSLSM